MFLQKSIFGLLIIFYTHIFNCLLTKQEVFCKYRTNFRYLIGNRVGFRFGDFAAKGRLLPSEKRHLPKFQYVVILVASVLFYHTLIKFATRDFSRSFPHSCHTVFYYLALAYIRLNYTVFNYLILYYLGLRFGCQKNPKSLDIPEGRWIQADVSP